VRDRTTIPLDQEMSAANGVLPVVVGEVPLERGVTETLYRSDVRLA
jgi:hypothetical protein